MAHLLIFVIVIGTFGHSSHGLYEDQIGKFDWKQSYIGPLKDGYIYGPQNDPKIVVVTADNVLAVLSAKSGDIVWRKIFERNDRGDIKFLHVDTDPGRLVRRGSSGGANDDIITISGANPTMVRGWDSLTGNLGWEWSLTPLDSTDHAALWFYESLYVYNVIPYFGSHLEVTAYYGSTGQQTKSTSTRIQAAWTQADSCVLAAPYFACVVGTEVVAIDLSAADVKVFRTAGTRDMTGLKPSLLRVSGGKILQIIGHSFLLYVRQGADATVVVGEDIFNLRSEVMDLKSKAAPIMFNDKYMDDTNVLLKGTVAGNVSCIHSF